MDNPKGLIIIGYQGIGKTTAAGTVGRTIDLESSLFKLNGERSVDWYKIYCSIAVSLAKQGYIVFVSSHKVVQDELATYNTNDLYSIATVCPHLNLKDQWIERLHSRYIANPTDKNYAAWKDAEAHFDEEIFSLSSNPDFTCVLLDSIDHYLGNIIVQLYALINGVYI